MFNIAANTVIPNYGAALTEGLQTGQNMQVNALAMETARQKMQQEAALQPLEMNKKMKEVQALALSNEEAQAKQIGAWANQVKDPVSYARFRDMMKNVLGETEEGLLEDGLVPEYTPEVVAILRGSVGIAQGVPDPYKEGALEVDRGRLNLGYSQLAEDRRQFEESQRFNKEKFQTESGLPLSAEGKRAYDAQKGFLSPEELTSMQGDSAAEEKVRRIQQAYNVDRRTAVGIADGVISVSTNPVTGQNQLVDKITGEQTPFKESLPPDTLNIEPQENGLYEAAPLSTGIESAIKNVSAYAQSIKDGKITPSNEAAVSARQDLELAQQGLVRALVVNDKFPVAEQEFIRNTLDFKPEWFKGGEVLQAKMRSVDKTLREQMATQLAYSNNPTLDSKTRQEARANAMHIKSFIEKMAVPKADNKTAGTGEFEGWSIKVKK